MGVLTGIRLKTIPTDTVSWSNWKSAYPHTEVLSRETGFTRLHGRNPYGNGCATGGTYFHVGNAITRDFSVRQ